MPPPGGSGGAAESGVLPADYSAARQAASKLVEVRAMRLILTKPDDWHLHLRDGEALRSVVQHTAREFARAIIMPNLRPPVETVAQAIAYRERILNALNPGSSFEPLMTLYLTQNTTPEEIEKAVASPYVHAVKLYPAGATTNSEAGVSQLQELAPIFEAMQSLGLPLLIHGEMTDQNIDIFDREARFVEEVLAPLVDRFSTLKVVLEHITTQQAAEFVATARAGVAATLTAHHLLLNRNALLAGGVSPDHYCLPILKREAHRVALLEAATSGSPKFFLGTDSAPHEQASKYTSCGCAGIFTAHAALPLYARAFEEAGALDRLEAFASFHGPDFYGLPRNNGQVELEKKSWTVPDTLPFGDGRLTPLMAGQELSWKVVSQ